jgi:Universal stress protein UspA and related nucleotide-binding proteins
MSRYQHILLAVDLHSDNKVVIERASELAATNGARLSVIHVIEPIQYGYADSMMTGFSSELVTLQEEIRKEAQKKLNALVQEFGLKVEQELLRSGRPADEIHAAVEDAGIDLVIMGTHGQHGLQLLLGSTANSVLHGCPCDVLAVRIHAKKKK